MLMRGKKGSVVLTGLKENNLFVIDPVYYLKVTTMHQNRKMLNDSVVL